MRFIFPQQRGLGYSSMADFSSIGSRGETPAYLAPLAPSPKWRLP
jgi:uncharacterized protein (DUF1810 family)